MVGRNTIALFSPLTLVTFLMILSYKGNLVLDLNIELAISVRYFPQIELVSFFWQSKDQGSQGIHYVAHFPFGKKSFVTNAFEIDPPYIIYICCFLCKLFFICLF